MLFDDKDADYVKIALEEIMKYRCAVEVGGEYTDIIRQLPFQVAMETSEWILPYPVTEAERQWYKQIVNDDSYIFHVPPPREIPKEEHILRKHLIYPSARGGYNIKTIGIDDRSLNHYCYTDSKKWD